MTTINKTWVVSGVILVFLVVITIGVYKSNRVAELTSTWYDTTDASVTRECPRIQCPICPDCPICAFGTCPPLSGPPSTSSLATIEPAELSMLQKLFTLSYQNYKREIEKQWKFLSTNHVKKRPFLGGEPFFSCPTGIARIGGMDDGAKFICGLNFFPKEDCVIYSLGVNKNTKFEWGLYEVAPHCKIFSFDPTPSLLEYYKENPQLFPPTQQHHTEAVTGKKGAKIVLGGKNVPSRALKEVRDAYQHKEIHVFKIDIEKGEYELFKNLDDESWDSMLQIQVEFHVFGEKVDDFIQMLSLLDKKGFVMFMKDANLYCPACYEFSFLNIKKFAKMLGLSPADFPTSMMLNPSL